jgi:uncharacterized membrane protein
MRFPLAAVAVLALAACSPAAEAPEPAPPAAEPAAVLGGVDLGRPVRVGGTEPFWSVELTATELIYGGPDRPEQRAPRPATQIAGTTATFESVTAAGTSISVMLAATECSDGMSDRIYPLSAIVRIGDETLTGCAASTAAIMAGGESGPVAEPAQPAG